MRRITYKDKEYLIHTRSGMRLIDSMREQGIPVECNCKKDPSSRLCLTRYPRSEAFLLTEPTELERSVLTPQELDQGYRLACQALFK
ncbi:hypothetical protein [Caldinitratiruptor microaerophilus]|uniref:Ferredoxin n=1 Tax=Caldinitratiruptor microaerophilus TaxID=671077 RepID=A0AA35G650_9FIRM|nr:hypothetical protein [Caldinitratiruptor microaerophilus]BDG60721.1 hypothetical protein caldi_18110 [Caldinitratiruptor microaerophilus]